MKVLTPKIWKTHAQPLTYQWMTLRGALTLRIPLFAERRLWALESVKWPEPKDFAVLDHHKAHHGARNLCKKVLLKIYYVNVGEPYFAAHCWLALESRRNLRKWIK